MNKIVLFLLTTFVCTSLTGQNLMQPIELFSKKKTAYITLQDGTELEGKIDKLKRKKGLVRLIILEMEDGSEREIIPSEINYAFLPQSGFGKFASDIENAYDLTDNFADPEMSEKIKDGYGYFAYRKVKLKKGEEELLLQLLNPHFNKGIQVYHDPYASESTSMNVGGFKVAGGVDKSYFILPPGEEVAWKIKKKDYTDELEAIFGACEQATDDGEKRVRWSQFPNHIFRYQEHCIE